MPARAAHRLLRLPGFVMLLVVPLSFVTPAQAAGDWIPITVTITKVDADSDGLEGLGRDEADLYAGVWINGDRHTNFFDNVIVIDDDHIEPLSGWTFTGSVFHTFDRVRVEIQIWDWDDCEENPFCTDDSDEIGALESGDDQADVDPKDGDRTVDIDVWLNDGHWTGDANWPVNCLQGTGDDDARVCWDIVVGSTAADSDGDGLLDGWERNGFNADGDASIDVDLPAMGARWNHKDLFLELDYEAGQQPARADILAMKAAFAAAPLGNPDGTTGVTLHVDMGNLVDPTAREGQPPGTCSDGINNGGVGPIDGADPDCKYLDASVEDPGPTTCNNGGDDDGDGLVDAADPDCLVGDNLGGGSAVTPAGACNLDSTFYAAKKANFDSNRRWIFRYAVSAALPGTCPGSGGWGEIGGNDFMEFNHDGGTIMHELGHTLNLRHGGFEGANCKPDYVSGMNYDNQFGINRAGGGVIIDYSPPRIALNGSTRGVAPLGPLVENGLNESTILDATDNQNQFVFTDATGAKIPNPLNAGADWNGDGDTADGAVNPVNIDTNATGGGPSACANTSTTSTLTGSEDWTTRVSIPFRQFGDSADGAINPVTGPELTLAELEALHDALNTTDLRISVTDSPDWVAAGEQLTYSLTVDNLGKVPANSVQVTDTLSSDVSVASLSAGCAASSGTVTCNLGSMAAHTSTSLTFVVNVPANLVYTNGGPKTITNVASVTNLLGPDSDTSNNSDTDTTLVKAKADVSISAASATSPLEVLIGQSSSASIGVTVANGGPSSPIDVVVSGTATATAGVSISPATTTDTVTGLAIGTPRTVSRSFTIDCTAPGRKSISFDYSIAPKNADDIDPNLANNHATASFTIDCVVPIAINVRPKGFPNSINLNTDATLAALTTKAGEYGLPLPFDATKIDPLAVRWGLRSNLFNVAITQGAKEIHNKGHLERSYELDEKTRDADLDMVLHFKPSASALTRSSTEGCLKGSYTAPDGNVYRFLGCDSVRIVN